MLLRAASGSLQLACQEELQLKMLLAVIAALVGMHAEVHGVPMLPLINSTLLLRLLSRRITVTANALI